MSREDRISSISSTGSEQGEYSDVSGFYLNSVAAGLTAQEMSRTGGRYRARFPGRIVGVVIQGNQTITAGQLTVEIFYSKNGVEYNTGLGVLYNAADGTLREILGTADPLNEKFTPGVDIYPKLTTSADWAPASSNISCTITLEG